MLSPAITTSATQTRLSPPITTAQRHPDQALPTNHNGTALPRPGPPHQAQRHSATQTRPSPPITTAQRCPDQALPTNHNGTAPPRHGTATHSSTQATPIEANPKGTAHRAHRESARSCAHARDCARTCANVSERNPKIRTNTVPPPDPPDKNKNPSLRIREKGQRRHPRALVW